MIYYAKLHKSGKGYWTEFPDLNTTGSEGRTTEEIKKNSKEALEGILESLFDRECKIPLPKQHQGKQWIPIQVEDSIAIPIVLRQLRLSHGLTLKQMASELGIAYQTYQTLETIKESNPTIKTLRKVANVFEIPVFELLKKVA